MLLNLFNVTVQVLLPNGPWRKPQLLNLERQMAKNCRGFSCYGCDIGWFDGDWKTDGLRRPVHCANLPSRLNAVVGAEFIAC